MPPPPTPSEPPSPPPPPPIPVRSVKPSGSDIAAESSYHDFGGGVNPLAYKGYDFHGPAYFSPSHASPIKPPSSFKFAATRRPNFPVYDFGDDDETVLSINVHHPTSPNPQLQLPTPAAKEPHNFLCCPLLGPVSPFVATLTLAHVGCSTVLAHAFYLVWRLLLVLASFSVFVLTAVDDFRFLAYSHGAALVFSVLNHVLLLRRALLYRRIKKDHDAIVERSTIFGWNAFVFQGTLHLCLMVGITYSVHSLFVPPDRILAGAEYVGSLSSYFLLALTVFHIVDVFITPIPFRVSHILPVALYSMLLSLITNVFFFVFAVWRSEGVFSTIAVMVVGLSGLVSGLLLHFMGRAFYLLYHQKRVAAENLIAPVVPDARLEKV